MSQTSPVRKESAGDDTGGGFTTPAAGAKKDNNKNNNSSAAQTKSNDKKFSNPAYLDALEDVHTRFILNLPDSELQSTDRIFFQVEQAWWFYEDWICDPDPDCALPRFSSLKPFALQLFEYSPLLPKASQFREMWQQFGIYKKKISNYGCILLNKDCSRVILCQLWNSTTHTFPAGKINQGEDGLTAAARETYEETGFDPLCTYGLTAQWNEELNDKVTWKKPTEADALNFQEADDGKRRTSYVCAGVPDDFPFAPVARKEVSNVAWHDLDNLPSKSYAVIPFVGQLKRWIRQNCPAQYYQRYGKEATSSATKKRDKTPNNNNNKQNKTPTRDRNRKNNSRNNSRSKVRSEDDLVQSGLANVGDMGGWSEEDMFRVNEELMGRKVEYDGNPHVFAEQGFAGEDPHAFRVVGGGFLNAAGGIASLAPAPDRSKLQPLFRSNADDDGGDDAEELQPFFSDDGATPWGDVVLTGTTNDKTTVKIRKTKPSKKTVSKDQLISPVPSNEPTVDGEDDMFLTDAEITAQSQKQKADQDKREAQQRRKYEEDTFFIHNWVANLPRPTNKHFGELKLDADEIMTVALASLKEHKIKTR